MMYSPFSPCFFFALRRRVAGWMVGCVFFLGLFLPGRAAVTTLPNSFGGTHQIIEQDGLVTVAVTPPWTAAYIDFHYTLDNGASGSGNYRMNNTGNVWNYPVIGARTGKIMTYWFVYMPVGGLQNQTANLTHTIGDIGQAYTLNVQPAATSATFLFTPKYDTAWADIHLHINGGPDLGYRMTQGATWSFTATSLPAGATVQYSVLYQLNKPAVMVLQSATGTLTLATNSTPTPPATPPPTPTNPTNPTTPVTPTQPTTPMSPDPTGNPPVPDGSSGNLTEASGTLYLQGNATTSSAATLSSTIGSGSQMTSALGTSATAPLAYEAKGLTAAYDASEGGALIQLYATASGTAGRVVFARLLYDFNGDGQWDRIETWNGFGLSPRNVLEEYAGTSSTTQTVQGSAFRNFANGRVRLEVWSLNGMDFSLRVNASGRENAQSIVVLPYALSTQTYAAREPSRRPAAYPESVLTSGQPTSSWGGGASAYPLSTADVNSRLTQGLAIYRSPSSMNGACASCHSPDGYDIAKIGFSDATIRRRALAHVSSDQADQLVEYIHAMRVKYGIQRPLNPATYRPMQPQFEALPGATPDDRDVSFMNYLHDTVKLKLATDFIDTEDKAVATEAQLQAIDLSTMKIGVPLDRWSEDRADGLSSVESSTIGGHSGSVAEWIPFMATRPKAGQEAAYYALYDAYAANPTDANFWRYYDAIGDITESATDLTGGTYQLGYNWMQEKYRALAVATHMLRHDTIDYPKRTADLPGDDLVANRATAIARDPIWRVGDIVRANPFYPQSGVQTMIFPAAVDASIDPRLDARTEMVRIIQLSWFWAGWQIDPALLTSDSSFATVSGDYFYPLNQDRYKIHYAFILAKMSVDKANATDWGNYFAPGVDGHGMWASIRPFLALKHSIAQRARPGTSDPRYAQHSLIIGNTAAMWILMVDRDLRLNHRVYDAYGTLACVNFARTLMTEMEPQHDWSAVDAALARIRTTLANPAAVTDVRAPYSIDYGMYLELYQALGIPPAPYQRN